MFTKYVTPKTRYLGPFSHKGYTPRRVTGEPRHQPSQQHEAEGGRHGMKVERGMAPRVKYWRPRGIG